MTQDQINSVLAWNKLQEIIFTMQVDLGLDEIEHENIDFFIDFMAYTKLRGERLKSLKFYS